MNTTGLPTYQPTPVDTARPVMAVPGTNVQMSLSGVSFQIYPLKASMARLTEFCDLYLNCTHEVDRPPFFFRPALPYVLLQIVDYGRMQIEWQNAGWFGARELCFTIPLEFYRRRGNELVFCDWATIAPFIFANNPVSVRNGREVYGWPKVAMQMDDLTPILDPLDRDLVIRLNLEVPAPPNSAQKDRFVPFLDVVREPAPFQSVFRTSGDLITAAPNALAKSVSFMSDAARSFADFGAYQQFNDMGYLQAASDMGFQYLKAVLPRVIGDRRIAPFPQPIGYAGSAINLKQFRDAENPNTACYQAITRSIMTLERLNDAGLLLDLTSGDPPSGRFLLRLFPQTIQPIVENLGLEVAGYDSVGDWTVALLEPQLPFWMNADLNYGQGETLCWRSKCSGWSEDVPLPAPPPVDPKNPGIPYVPMGSGALQEISGPFTFPTLTVRVLPLLANYEKLREYCKKYLCDQQLGGTPYKFKPWGPYVYLLAASYDQLTAKLNSAGLSTDQEVAIIVPIRIYRHDPKAGDTLVKVGLLPAFTFVGCQVSAITDREVYGRPTLLSELESPPTNWMNVRSKPDQLSQPLLNILTQILPSDYVGAEVKKRSVLEIHRGRYPSSPAPPSKPLWDWAHKLLWDYRGKVETASNQSGPLEIVVTAMLATIFYKLPIFSVALKEFMDADDLSKACLRALVQVSRSIDPMNGIGEFAHPLHLEIPRYDTLPIVESLGLEVKCTTTKWDSEIGNVEVDIIEPIRPFWIQMAMSGGDSKNLCLRAGTEPNWHTNDCCGSVPSEPPFGEKGPRLPFGGGLLEKLGGDWMNRPPDIAAGEWLRIKAEEWLRDLLTKELVAILNILLKEIGADQIQEWLRSQNLSLSLPFTDESLTAFASSLPIGELLR